MRMHATQSGFTPTPNFTQSCLRRLRRCLNTIWSYAKKILERREQGSQRENWCRGFSLVETLVAVTILLIAILGPMAITSQSSQSTSFSSEQVVAFFLAQEGAELVQKARNDLFNQYLLPSGSNHDPWDDFTDTSNGALFEECYETTGCGLEISSDSNGNLRSPVSCDGSAACALSFNPLSGTTRSRYTHVPNTLYIDTPYSRVITMQNVSAAEVKVVSTVTWRSGNLRDEQSVSVETYLFNTYAY